MRLAVAIDIGATWIRAAIINEKGELIHRTKVETRGESMYSFKNSIREAYEALPRDLVKESLGVGIGSIGPMDLKRGILNPPNIAAKNIDLREIMSELVKEKNVYLANDCVAAVIGEYFYGQGAGHENIVYITISTGIGAGVIVDGEPLVGKDGNAHEIGHLVIERSSGIRCGCGGIGHWEGLCSGANIPRYAEEIYYRDPGSFKNSILVKKIFEKRLTSKDIYEAYYSRDPLAVKIVDECNEIHSAGVASVINAYDPEKVIFGGTIVLMNKWIIDEINRRIDKYITNRKPELVVTEFGDDVVLVGAGAIVLNEFSKKNRFRIL